MASSRIQTKICARRKPLILARTVRATKRPENRTSQFVLFLRVHHSLTLALSCKTMPRMKTSRFLLRGFRRPREIACFALGKLERQVMEETWRLGEVSVRDIYRAFNEQI